MSKYTVILLRPDYMCDDIPFGQNICVIRVAAEDLATAIEKSRDEVFEDDTKAGMEPDSPDDYALVVVFDEYVMPTLLGWQE